MSTNTKGHIAIWIHAVCIGVGMAIVRLDQPNAHFHWWAGGSTLLILIGSFFGGVAGVFAERSKWEAGVIVQMRRLKMEEPLAVMQAVIVERVVEVVSRRRKGMSN